MWKVLVVCALIAYAAATPAVNDNWRQARCINAALGAFPQIVSIRTSGDVHFCGGTILNSVNILTGAQCVVGRTAANTIIIAGTHLLNSGGQRRSPSRFMIHPNFNSNTIANDVAVVRLASGLDMGGTVQEVSLNTENVGVVAAVLVGWGRTSMGGVANIILRELDTETMNPAVCQSLSGSAVSAMQICTSTQPEQCPCEGDIGGPLFLASNRAQIGIVSSVFTGGCAIGRPILHTRVSPFVNWITSAANS